MLMDGTHYWNFHGQPNSLHVVFVPIHQFSCFVKWKLGMIFLQVPKILNNDNYFICNSLPWGFLEALLRAFPKWKPNKSGNVFGGFTMLSWGLSNNYYNDPNAFIFSLTNKDNQQLKMKINSNDHKRNLIIHQ